MAQPNRLPDDLALPRAPIATVLEPLNRFLHVQAASGVVLLLAAIAAFAAANSPAGAEYLAFWKTPLVVGIGGFVMSHSLQHWISDGLMAIFFFVVGLEVKRELVLGQLRTIQQAALPIAGALGGMIVPAAIYLALQWGQPGAVGWGIPMATDIAFVVGALALLGSRVPAGLRVMLLSLAIADDIGAILVIAIGYTSDLNTTALFAGIVGLGLVMLVKRAGVRSIGLYAILGTGVWVAFHESGVHATIAGVILGILTPARRWVNDSVLSRITRRVGDLLDGEGWDSGTSRHSELKHVEIAVREAQSPVERLEHGLHPWSAFIIMPIFALANAGVPFDMALLTDPIATAVAAGLVIGKPAGIFLFCYALVRLGGSRLPEGVSWSVLFGGACLAGIGFTMAIFIAGLALDGAMLDAAKVGVLAASLVSGALGMAILALRLPAHTPTV